MLAGNPKVATAAFISFRATWNFDINIYFTEFMIHFSQDVNDTSIYITDTAFY